MGADAAVAGDYVDNADDANFKTKCTLTVAQKRKKHGKTESES